MYAMKSWHLAISTTVNYCISNGPPKFVACWISCRLPSFLRQNEDSH